MCANLNGKLIAVNWPRDFISEYANGTSKHSERKKTNFLTWPPVQLIKSVASLKSINFTFKSHYIHSYWENHSPFPPSSNLTSLYSPDVISQTFAYIQRNCTLCIPLQQNNIHMENDFVARKYFLLIILHCPWL